MTSPLLEVKDLDVHFGALHAVRAVSFSVAPGETLGVVGESGSGKSTTMLAVLGLHPKRQGTVTASRLEFDGEDLLSKSDRAMRDLRGRRVGLIFQDPLAALNPLMTVGRQIGEVLVRHHGLDKHASRAEAVKLLERTGVPDPLRRAAQFPHQFSGGMRQRAMIAIALACSPKLLLADEPTTALDVTIQDQILKLLLDLRDRLSMSVVLVTHDLGVVAATCDRMAVMYAGRIVETGTVVDVFAQPRHPYTRGLLGSVPRGRAVRTMLRSIDGTPPSLTALPDGCAFHPRCSFATDQCRMQRPPLAPVAPGRQAACFHHEKVAASEAIL